MDRIDADILIPGRGDPIADASVVVEAGTITYAGPRVGAPAMLAVHVPVVMPGLWDCHGHFFGMTTLDTQEVMHTPVPVAAVRAAKTVEAALGAGFTSVREAGGLGVHMARLVDEGILVGPSIYAPGAILSQTGGHGDIHAFPVSWVIEMCERGGFSWLCDGVPECLKAVRSQLRLGAKVIKICASGGVMSELDHPVHQQFSGEELRAIVEEAGRAERVVMAHCHGKPGIMAALEAGVRTIEHGSYLDEEAAAAMRETGAVFVPTRLIVEQGLLAKDRMPDYAYQKMVAIADSHLKAMTIAHEAGVTIALGTDIFATGPATGLYWGMNGRELVHLVDAGLTPIEAIEAGTANGPLTLGPQAPRSGQLAEGYDADIIAVATSPLEDVAVLADPSNVTHVWKAGALVKSPVGAGQS
ncbi:MAG: metal-dependent hydrolase family protein [Acidimicrobiales bacterium]